MSRCTSITIELSMGHRKGSIGEAAKEMARQILGKFKRSEVDLRKMRAVLDKGKGIPNEEVNLIEEVLSISNEIDLPDNDPLQNYERRREWLKQQVQSHA